MAGMGLDLEGRDPKTGVNMFCQRYCSRPVAKDDIVYTTHKHSGGYQSTVMLNCIEGHEFAGEVASTAKDAEKSAAKQVLEFFATEIASMPVSGSKQTKKRKAVLQGEAVPAGQLLPGTIQALSALGEADPKLPKIEPEPVKTAKGELNACCSKILRRVMQKGEVMYETNMVPGGFQSTVQLPGLPDEWGNQVWAGEVCAKKTDAEQSVAAIALEAISADPQLMALFNQPPKPKTWRPPMKGKGKGGSGYGSSSPLGGSFGASSLGAGYGSSLGGGLGYAVGAAPTLAMGGFGAFGGYGMGSHAGGFA